MFLGEVRHESAPRTHNAHAAGVAEVGRLTNLPTRYEQHLPRKDLAAPLFLFALGCILALLGARLLEVPTWQA